MSVLPSSLSRRARILMFWCRYRKNVTSLTVNILFLFLYVLVLLIASGHKLAQFFSILGRCDDNITYNSFKMDVLAYKALAIFLRVID